MAVIKTETLYLGGIQFKKQTKVSGNGEFSIDLPSHVADILGFDKVTGKTNREVQDTFREACRQYEAAKTSTRKVILYKIESNAYIWGVQDDNEDGVILHKTDIFHCVGTALSVAAAVYQEVRIQLEDGKVQYRYDEVGRESNLPEGLRHGPTSDLTPCGHEKAENVLDWTEERHAFFIMIHDAVNGLILKLNELKTPATLIDFIDSGVKLIENDRNND